MLVQSLGQGRLGERPGAEAAPAQGARSLGPDVVAGQLWISTRDGRTRPDHADADGQVVPIGSPFSVAGGSLAYPGDPAGDPADSINCRCTIAFLTPDEMGEAA